MQFHIFLYFQLTFNIQFHIPYFHYASKIDIYIYIYIYINFLFYQLTNQDTTYITI